MIGGSIFEKGKDFEGVDENGKFLYETINEALEDGWCNAISSSANTLSST